MMVNTKVNLPPLKMVNIPNMGGLWIKTKKKYYSDQPHMPPLHRDPVINHFRYKDYPLPGFLILDLHAMIIAIVNVNVSVFVIVSNFVILIPIA